MTTSKQDLSIISLPTLHTGELLSECVRAYLHNGTPSALLFRLLHGMQAHLVEATNKQDCALISLMYEMFDAMHESLRKAEDGYYTDVDPLTIPQDANELLGKTSEYHSRILNDAATKKDA